MRMPEPKSASKAFATGSTGHKMDKSNLPQNAASLRWWSDPRALLRYVLALDDTPHHIALGTAIGMFIGLTPTVGIQMGIVVAVYFLLSPFLRFNCAAALVTVYISNPLTMLPLYWFDYCVGRMLIGGNVTRDELAGILTYDGFADWWRTMISLFIDLGATMFVGSAIVASCGALITYPLMRYLFHNLRRPKSDSPEMTSNEPGATSIKTPIET